LITLYLKRIIEYNNELHNSLENFYMDYLEINMVYINYIKIFDAEIYNP